MAEKKDRFAEVIREARKAAGMNQFQLAESLEISRNTVAGWETGHSRPPLDAIPSLCRALNLSTGDFFGLREELTQEERTLLSAFRGLGREERQMLLWQTEGMIAGRKRQLEGGCGRKAGTDAPGFLSGAPGAAAASRAAAARKRPMKPLSAAQVVSLYRNDLAAAAGFGGSLGEDQGERVWLKRDGMTARADEIITVNGRSMEPTFFDGDQVLVQHAESLREGEIGIFTVDGEGYIKEFRRDGLYSHNRAYEPMRFSEGSEVRCVGRVLGRVTEEQRLTEEEAANLEVHA